MGLREILELLYFIVTQGAEDVILVNNTLKNHDVTVPEGETWEVFGGRTHNADDVARNCSIIAYDENNVLIATLDTLGALVAATVRTFPRNNQAGAEHPLRSPLLLAGGDYVRYHFAAGGASTGGTAKIHLNRKVYERYS